MLCDVMFFHFNQYDYILETYLHHTHAYTYVCMFVVVVVVVGGGGGGGIVDDASVFVDDAFPSCC